MNIDKRAIVSEKAKIGQDVEIGPFAIIEEDVELERRVKVWPHAHVCSGSVIGEETQIHMGAVVGHVPQDLTFENKRSFLNIGKRNVIREYVTIHRGTKEGSATVIGDDCYLMAVSHIGHNCHIGNKVIIANCALLAGHVTVEDGSFISGNVVVHQFCRIGELSIIGGFTGINKDVPPYMLVRGPSVVRGVNLIGLRRSKLPKEGIDKIKEAFRLLYESDLNTAQAIDQIKKLGASKELSHLVEFIQGSKRGICKYKYSDAEYFE